MVQNALRCSLNRVTRQMQQVRPDVPLWKLSFEDFLRYVELERDALEVATWNREHPRESPRQSYIEKLFGNEIPRPRTSFLRLPLKNPDEQEEATVDQTKEEAAVLG